MRRQQKATNDDLMMTLYSHKRVKRLQTGITNSKRQVKDQDIKVNTKGMPMSADHGVTYDGSDNCVTIPKLNTRVSLSHAFARFTN